MVVEEVLQPAAKLSALQTVYELGAVTWSKTYFELASAYTQGVKPLSLTCFMAVFNLSMEV